MPLFLTGTIDTETAGGTPATWVATGRSGGVSGQPYDGLNLADYVGDAPQAVEANRRRVAAELGVPHDRFSVMTSVHGSEVAVVTVPGAVRGVDALVTQVPDLAVMALAADCVPLVIAGADGRTVAAIHCGWRGLVADVVGATVAALADLGTCPDRVVVGPAVCGACYPVPWERADRVREWCSVGVARAALVPCPDGQPGIDVRAGVVARLTELAVAPGGIALVGGCTVEDAGLFSFRRDGVTGRHGLAIVRRGSAGVVGPPQGG